MHKEADWGFPSANLSLNISGVKYGSIPTTQTDQDSVSTNDKAGTIFNLLRWVSPQAIKETFVPATNYMYPNFLEE